MTEQEALAKMIAPGTRRPGKYREGVVQIHVTRACDKSCFGCTQGSNLGGRMTFISPAQFETAVQSLQGYFGVVGVFGGNPALHPQFDVLCEILRNHVPFSQRGLWCNHPFRWGKVMRETFDPSVSNLNVHLDKEAHYLFKKDWPESNPFGLHKDSRHAPCYVAMKDVIEDEATRWSLISDCDINKHWSAMIGVFRGELRAWFCEIAGAQSILHQDEPDYPDTGSPIPLMLLYEDGVVRESPVSWWRLRMDAFAHQVRKHCHECSVPLRGYGELAQGLEGSEQVSQTHQSVFKPKRKGRAVELVTVRSQLSEGRIGKVTEYIQNTNK